MNNYREELIGTITSDLNQSSVKKFPVTSRTLTCNLAVSLIYFVYVSSTLTFNK
jgi:hypothetical protein